MITEINVTPANYNNYLIQSFLFIVLLNCLLPGINILANDHFDFVFVQVPANSAVNPSGSNKNTSLYDRYVQNTRIVRYDGELRAIKSLTSEFYAACDPDISFDGLNIIFSGKISAQDRWQIWSMKTDGSQKVQLTSAAGDCWMPVYAGSRFYLNDPQPTPQIVYAGNEHSWYNDLEAASTLALYGVDLEGKQKYRLTYNLYSDFSPDVLPDGRIVFSSWQPSGEGKLALMAVNVDGTDLMPYYGNHELPKFKEMVHVSDKDASVYYIESDQLSWLGGGSIASISHRRPLHSYQKKAISGEKIYHSPCTLPDGTLIASCKSISENDEYSVYYLDQETGSQKDKIYGQAGWHTIDTQIISPHPMVKGKSNWLIPGTESGVFYCLNSYRSDQQFDQNIMPGQIKYVRVIEGLPQIKNKKVEISPKTERDQNVSATNPGKVLGTAPVEADGSFHVRVPAMTPLNFQLLDKNFFKIREQKGWTWVMGNENRGCIGCHENRELSPPNVLVSAIPKPAVDLTEVPEKRRRVDFINQIMPMLGKNCAKGCHGVDESKSGLRLVADQENRELRQEIYNNLLSVSDKENGKRWVKPGSASKSSILDYLTSEKVPESSVSQNHAENLLTQEEILILIEWIDLGAQYDLSTYPLNPQKQ